jgi:bile acid-coenzyme A ligase
VVLVPGPLYHNAPFTCAAAGLFAGAHVVLLKRFDPAATLAAIERHQVDFVLLVPTMMHRIWQLDASTRDRYDLSSLRRVWHMGAPCPTWLKEGWIGWIGPDLLFELYGGTERQAYTVIDGRDWLAHRGSVGRAAFGEVRIIAADGSVAPAGTHGQIQLRAPADERPTYRYVGAETPEASDGWDTLGDLGSMDADGYLYVDDRRTDLILTGGANVYPAEVEGVIEAHPSVRSAVVVGLPDDDLGQRVHAIVEARGVDEARLRRFVEERLVRYKVPRSFEFVDEALRDDAGKVRRSALRAQRITASPGS